VTRTEELRAELESAERRHTAFSTLMQTATEPLRAEYAAAQAELEPYMAGLRRKLEASGAQLIADLQRARKSHWLHLQQMRQRAANLDLESYQRDFATAEVARVEAVIAELEISLLELGESVQPSDTLDFNPERAPLETQLSQANFEAHSANHLRHLLRWQLVQPELSESERIRLQDELASCERRFQEAVTEYNATERNLGEFDSKFRSTSAEP
jgi:hypothetical protein